MTDDDDFELIRGTGNVYADLGMKEPEQRQLRAILAAEISKTLSTDNLTCLLYTSPSPRDRQKPRMPSSA